MAVDNVVEIPGYPVNAQGEIVFKKGAGTTDVVGVVPIGGIPAETTGGKLAAVFEGLPNLTLDSGSNATGISDEFGGIAIERRPAYKKRNFFQKRPNVLDNMDACLSLWTVPSGTVTADYNVTRPNTPSQCSLSVANVANFTRWTRDFGAGNGIRPDAGTLIIPVYISQMPISADGPPSVPVNCSVSLRICTDNNFSGTTSACFATSLVFTSTQFLRQGWNDCQINVADIGDLNTTGTPSWTYSGTTIADPSNLPAARTVGNATTFRYLQLELGGFAPTSFSSPVVKIGGIYQGGESKPNIILNCDDAQQDTIDLIRVFNARRAPVSVPTVTGSIGAGQFLSVAQLQTLNAAGNDITSHTVSHPVLTTLNDADLQAELRNSKRYLLNNKMPRTSDIIAYPTNAFDDRVLAAVKAAGYSAGRGSKPGWTPTVFGLDNSLALGSRDIGGKTLAQVLKVLDSAQTYKCTVILYMHQIAFTALTGLTFSGGVATATHAAGTAVPVGTVVYLRGFDASEHNIACTVTSSTTTGFTAAAPGVANGTGGNSLGLQRRFFSPTWPASGGTPPANTLYWYLSDYIALANEIAARWNTGALTPITFADLLDECTY